MRINSWGKSNEVNSVCIPSKQNQWHSPHEERCAPSPPRDLVWATDTYKERLHEAHTHFFQFSYVDYFFKVFIEFIPILLLFNVLVFCLQDLWDLSSPTRDRTRIPCIEMWRLNHWTARQVLDHTHFGEKKKMDQLQQAALFYAGFLKFKG